jgi:hypothetical protein
MRLVLTFFIPTIEKRAIEWMPCKVSLVWIDIFGNHLGHELRNPLAFAHEGLNLLAAQIMSKQARTSFFEEQQHCRTPAADFSQPVWLWQYRKCHL